MYIINKETPPPFDHVEYFERSSDPFNSKIIMSALVHGTEPLDKPETGWMAIDWIENPVGFFPDGTKIESSPPNFELDVGYYKDGRMFAYCLDRDNAKLKQQHLDYKMKMLKKII